MSSNSHLLSALGGSGITKFFTDEVSYTWTIENFYFHATKREPLESSTFVAATNDKYKWRLEMTFYAESFYLSLKLNLGDPTISNEVYAEVFFHILDKNQRAVLSYPTTVQVYKYQAGAPSEYFSWPKQHTKNNTRLFDKNLTVRCDVTFSDMKNITTSDRQLFQAPKCDLSKDMSSLFENHHLSDVVLSANGKDYPAHRNILAARSTVFAAMFKYNTKEKTENRVEISDMNEEVLGEMLRYIYTGKCENLKNLTGDLLAAADKYALDRLKIMCAEELYENLSIENVSQILSLAEMYRVNELRKEAIKLIAANPTKVFSTADGKSLLSNPELLEEVFQKK